MSRRGKWDTFWAIVNLDNRRRINQQLFNFALEDSLEKEVRRLLSIPSDLKVAFSQRLGYPSMTNKYFRVCRDVDDFTRHNRFSSKRLD